MIIVAKLSDTAIIAIAIINEENVLRLLKAILRTMKNSRFNACLKFAAKYIQTCLAR